MRGMNPGFFMVCANDRENELIDELNRAGLRWKELQGCYKGIPERSFLIVDSHSIVEGMVLEYASKYSQESYLKVDADCRTAWLVLWQNNTRVKLGKFDEVSKAVALAASAYTFDPSTKRYYLAKGSKHV